MAKRTNDEFVAAFLGMSPEEINEGLIQGRWKSNRGKSVARQVLAGELDPAKARAKLNQEAKDEAKALKAEVKKAAEPAVEAPKAAEVPKPVVPKVEPKPAQSDKAEQKATGVKQKEHFSNAKKDK